MGIRSQKLSDFFNIGLDLGWDVEKQKWTVNQLISPEGISWTLSDVIDGGFPLENTADQVGQPLSPATAGGPARGTAACLVSFRSYSRTPSTNTFSIRSA